MLKKLFLLFTLLFIPLTGCSVFTGTSAEEYKDQFEVTLGGLNFEAQQSSLICSTFLKKWSMAVNNPYMSPESAINEARKKLDGDISSLKSEKKKIDERMKGLQNPPKEYKESYDMLVDLHEVYGKLYRLAENPTGSYMSYSSEVSSLQSEFISLHEKITITKP